jgi:hypothetical protein
MLPPYKLYFFLPSSFYRIIQVWSTKYFVHMAAAPVAVISRTRKALKILIS